MRFVCLDENCTWEMEGEYVSRSSAYIRQHEETLGGGHRVVRASESTVRDQSLSGETEEEEEERRTGVISAARSKLYCSGTTGGGIGGVTR